MKKKFLSLVLAAAMGLSLVACGSAGDAGNGNDAGTNNSQSTSESQSSDNNAGSTEGGNAGSDVVEDVDLSTLTYDEASEYIYNAQLGEFYDAYMTAKEATSVSERYALMAVAEAKLMESAVMVPTQTRGGRYAISRVAPYSATPILWGNDYERYHQLLIATEPLKAEDRAEIKAKYSELKGTGTFEQWSKDFLASKGYTLKDSYNYPYSSDPVTWDVLATARAADSEAIINTYDGLMEYDVEGVLQPALAESYEVSDDGLTYTFHIRQGVSWVDSQGRKVADVKADDFVAGMQHMMDAQGGLEYLVQGVIVNASEYIAGDVTDFAEVGVSAPDDATLVYTLTAPCSYFVTMLGYGVFAPMSRQYYTSMGGQFGAEYDPAAEGYKYGVDSNSIAYCGPYLVTNATAENTIVFSANPTYWNADKINIKTINWVFEDGSDPTKLYTDMKSGVLDGCPLDASTLIMAREEGLFDTYAYVSGTEATSFMGFYNLNRQVFTNFNDESAVVSTQTEEIAARTNKAMQNVHFRRALSFALDRASYNAQSAGEELKYNALRNSYTPGTFVSLKEDVTIDINGTATTFVAGTYYGEIMQAQVDADGFKATVWDPSADDGIGSSDGFDGWYNPANAVAELNIAIEELAAKGVTVDAANPIYIDFPYPGSIEQYANRANVVKQSIESALENKVIVNIVDAVDYAGWYYAGYYGDYGKEANYDLYDCSGWGPDYGDPAAYLDTFLPDYAGYMVKSIGIY